MLRVLQPCLTDLSWLLIGYNYPGVTAYTGVTSLAAKQVCPGPVKRASCTEFVKKVELRPIVCTFHKTG